MESLKDEKKAGDLKRKAINRMLKTKAGQLYLAFLKWKSLPSLKELKKTGYSSELGRQLEKILKQKLKDGFTPLLQNYKETQEIKKEAIRKMIIVTTGLTKHMFFHWNHVTIMDKDLEACKRVINIFNTVEDSLKNITTPLL
jgi:aspartate aminotransferase-like enzyme